MENRPPYELFRKLDLQFQLSDFLLVIDNEMEETKWKHFIDFAFKLGYIKILIHSTLSGRSYDKLLFPNLRLRSTTAKDYAGFRDSFGNLNRYPVRVAAYNNVPRSFIYTNLEGKIIHTGYYMKFALAFLRYRNATFVPVYTGSDSPQNCTLAIKTNKVDMCADALSKNPIYFTVTNELRIAAANVIVPHAKPLLLYRYLTAPFKTSVWLCLAIYVILIAGFMSLIHRARIGRWDFSRQLLEVFNSLLFGAFKLATIFGGERYILFGILFIAGFVYSTEYSGLLKSMMISEVFESEITTFEELAERRIPVLIDPYDRALFERHYMPDILRSVVKTVPSETLVKHRNNLDQNYAYVLFPDRWGMFEYAQHYLRHPKFRRIQIDFCFLFAGFPMRNTWFLKHHLSRSLYNGFESGLLDKMQFDSYREAVSQGYLNYTVTEHLEAKPLGLNHFLTTAIALALGYSLASISFLIELLAWKF
ncbi:uncharacterized protein [Drosophila bipectinata]|uniref:uncharacterized protein n=1 Tax=Drosophila bipectinata TaxID=42026 RepID=UPI001C89011E|nr:uncharacterized protein LOC108132840 [Drosophila bipectinata]